ncbi:MAG: hypothetical protein PHQ34_01325 [Methanothrix sp.]|nr:hypothetical protein [Methanothrix sp.]
MIGIFEKDIVQNEGLPPKKKSKLREEIESMLAEKGIALEARIAVMSMDSRQTYYFDDYPQALQFLKGKKGRWYLTTPGIKRTLKPGMLKEETLKNEP